MKNATHWLLAATLASLVPAMSGCRTASETKAEPTETSVSSKNTPLAMVEVAEMSVNGKSSQVQLTSTEQMWFSVVGVPIETSTSLRFKVSVPGKLILGADTAAWKIDSFTDDKGTDLFAAPGQAPKDSDLKKGLSVAEDGKSCHFAVEAVGSLPAADASRLSLSGAIALRCGSGRSTVAQENVALKVGTKITASPVPLSISAIKALGPSQGFDVTLKSSESIDRLLTIDIEGVREGAYSSGRGHPDSPDGTNTWVLNVPRIEPGLTLKVTSMDNVETVTIPVQVSTGLNMGD